MDNIVTAISEIHGPQQPPAELLSHSEKMRNTIRDVIGRLATDVTNNLHDLRRQIDELDQLVVNNAARVTDDLTEHANICAQVQQEIVRLNGVVAVLRAAQLEASQINGGTP
jgi:hypothetical protein